jgi:hypothetical protein
MCVCVCVCVCIYIYIYERERDYWYFQKKLNVIKTIHNTTNKFANTIK